ncbi:hypothetical protein CR205_16320 [Alteribacter lacisalsi]|uniref:ATPase BadF/BadG/BcrA/BcrD type domain-containing protein n=1 Tax=Alteribacter lacisalsi TaxID=2045244 RepID=A0A2W0H4J1_9BACI|nr:BadF/BadG/BcrA/BcrD ATPase family protein [Alteribacter lacisalsi]PYZ95941.1 hypothetical protein CR205_16320 [Alteribacter lacisalsi]
MLFIGIDGGGTKTEGVVTDLEGNVLSRKFTSSTNPSASTITVSVKRAGELTAGLLAALPSYGKKNVYIFAGIAGLGRKNDISRWTTEWDRQAPDLFGEHAARIQITASHDGVTALYSGTRGQSGVVTIAGTGSFSYGINQKGEEGRCGGWGYLAGDPGSGFAMGQRALQHALRELDQGYGELSGLTSTILDRIKCADRDGLLTWVYGDPAEGRTRVAGLTGALFNAADAGDTGAARIIKTEARHLADQSSTLIRRLFADEMASGNTVRHVLAGGLFNRNDWIAPVLEEEYQRQNLSVVNVFPACTPAEGAAAFLRREAGLE